MTAAPPRKLLVLDLDETLLYATDRQLSIPEAFRVGPYYAYLRPYVWPFLLVRVHPFEGQLEDDELLYLTTFLETVVGVDDVRVVDKRGWRHRLTPRQ